jgi:hypothetical protein
MSCKPLTVALLALAFFAPLWSKARAQNASPPTALHVTNNTGMPLAITVHFIRTDGQSRLWKNPRVVMPGDTVTLTSDISSIATRTDNGKTYYLIWIQGESQDGGGPLTWGKSGNTICGLPGVEWTSQENGGTTKHLTVGLKMR